MAGGSGRIDERDTMFARAARRPGSPAFEDYYARRPDLLAVDDRLRALPRLLEPGGRCWDAAVCGEAAALFTAIDDLAPDQAMAARQADRVRAGEPGEALKRLALELGALAAGCTAVDPAWVYSHKGRFDDDYGRPIDLELRFAVVFLVEMDHEAMRRAPRAEAIRESARQYLEAARIARSLEATLRAAGSAARAQYDAHYEVMLPPLAVAAGLGELGRNNLLIADRAGARVRIGAVMTDLPVEVDRPVGLGARHFCGVCGVCARSCPPRALSLEQPAEIRGVVKWPTAVERCYGYWRSVGTDCGICMSACPFSHPDTPLHRLVRLLVRRAPALHRLLRLLDDLVYGRGRPSPAGP